MNTLADVCLTIATAAIGVTMAVILGYVAWYVDRAKKSLNR